VPLSWFEDLEDESLDDVEDCEPWLAADLRDHDGSRTEAEEVLGYMDLAVAGVIMGDLNAVFAVETAHRRQLLAARALRPSSMLVPGTPFPRSDVITDVYVDDAAFLTMAPLRADGSVADLPVEEVDRADAMYSALGMPLAEDKKVNAEDAELWGGRLRGRQGTLAFPGARRASLMAGTCVGLLLGLSKQQAQRVLGAWNFAMGFRSLSCSALGLVYTAVDRMPSRGRICLRGPAQEDLLLAAGLAPLMLTNLRAQPSRVLFATDASPVAAGATMAPVPEHLWLQLYDWAEEKGEAVRLDWGSDPPPTELRDVRALSANVTCALDWSVVFSRAFIYPDHINVLELEAVILLIKRLSIDGWHHCRVLVAIDSRVVVGAIAKGRSSSRKLNFRLRKLAALLFLRDIYLEVIWVPTWANPADAPSRFKAMADWYRSIPTKIPTTLPGKLSREAAAEWENLAAPLTRAEADLRFTIDREIETRPEYATQPLPISARWDEAWRSILLLMAGDVHPHPGPAAYRGGRGRSRERRAEPGDILITDILPVTRDHYERELGKFEEWLRVRDMAGLDALLSQGVAALVAHTVTYLRQMYADHVFFRSASGLVGIWVEALYQHCTGPRSPRSRPRFGYAAPLENSSIVASKHPCRIPSSDRFSFHARHRPESLEARAAEPVPTFPYCFSLPPTPGGDGRAAVGGLGTLGRNGSCEISRHIWLCPDPETENEEDDRARTSATRAGGRRGARSPSPLGPGYDPAGVAYEEALVFAPTPDGPGV